MVYNFSFAEFFGQRRQSPRSKGHRRHASGDDIFRARFCVGLKKETTLFFIVFLIFVGGYNFNQYFTRWASNQAVANAFSLGHVSIAMYLNDLPEETKIYALWHRVAGEPEM